MKTEALLNTRRVGGYIVTRSLLRKANLQTLQSSVAKLVKAPGPCLTTVRDQMAVLQVQSFHQRVSTRDLRSLVDGLWCVQTIWMRIATIQITMTLQTLAE